jgi:hypothetical protein
VATIKDLLQPVYIRTLPLEDAWGNPFWLWADADHYRIVSHGRDGARDADHSVTEGAGGTSTFDSDIVMDDGRFSQWPGGPQRLE